MGLSSTSTSRILLADDNPDDRTLTAREIRRAFPNVEVREIKDPDDLTHALDEGQFDLVVTDYQLQWTDGLKILEAVKARMEDCPVIMFTATGTQEVAVEAMKRGLDDYLIKSPAHYVRLPAAVAAAWHRRDERAGKRRAEEDLRRALAEKELLLKELYHRVKNNMQIISSLLDLQAATIHDQRVLEMFRISQMRIRAMALVHEKLYQANDLTRISFSDYVSELISDLFSSFGIDSQRIQTKLKIDPSADYVPVDLALPCGLIINELLSNSVQHAFAGERRGEIRIELHPAEEGWYTLVVADNGPGLPRGFDITQSGTLGLSLVHLLSSEQMRAKVEISGGNGTEFRITFPLQ